MADIGYMLARAHVLALAVCVAGSITGCAADSYFGVPLTPGATDPELQSLARRAHQGDRFAMLALGMRYEAGRGLPVDLSRAESLYRQAASPAQAGSVYLPASPSGGRGSFIRTRVQGQPLPEAVARLESLQRRHPSGRGESTARSTGDALLPSGAEIA